MKKSKVKNILRQFLIAVVFFLLICPGNLRTKSEKSASQAEKVKTNRPPLAAGKVIPLNELVGPFMLKVDQKCIYIADGPKIKKFSRENFVLQKTIGKKGEGPGEYTGWDYPFLSVRPDGIWISCRNKILYFSHSGKLKKEIKKKSRDQAYKPVRKGERFIGYKIKLTREDFYLNYVLFDSELKAIKEIHQGKWIAQRNKKPKLFELLFYEVIDDKIVFAHYSTDFAIDILDAEGNLLYSIRRDDKKIPFTKKDKQILFDYWRQHPDYRKNFESIKRRFEFPEYYPAISTCRVANNKIYVITHLCRQNKIECLVYDMKGKFQKRIFIPLLREEPTGMYDILFSIYDEQLFQVIDNPEKETWELHINPIE
jgi:hypothetical protein